MRIISLGIKSWLVISVLLLALISGCTSTPTATPSSAPTVTVTASSTPTKTVTPLKPAQLKVNSAKINPGLVFWGQEANVEAEVTNIGEVKGELSVVLTSLESAQKDSKTVSLEPNQTAKVSFKISRNTTGKFGFAVGDVPANLEVIEQVTFKDWVFPYSISYPADWQLTQPTNNNRHVEMAANSQSPYASSTLSVDILDVPLEVGLNDFASTSTNNIVKQFTAAYKWETLGQTEVEKNGSVWAKQLEYRYTDSGKMTYHGYYQFIKQGKYGYHLRFQSLAGYETTAVAMACFASFAVSGVPTAAVTAIPTVAPTVTDTPKPSQTTLLTPTPTATLSQPSASYALNQPVTVGSNATWTVLAAKSLGSSLPATMSRSGTARTTTGKFVQVEFTLENKGDKIYNTLSASATIVDSKNREFKPMDGYWDYVPQAQDFNNIDLKPTLPKSFAVIYDVPADATGLSLKVSEFAVFSPRTALINLGL
jgi:hypothetical protein